MPMLYLTSGGDFL